MVVRLYSHMVRSFVEKRWIPEGMPGFYKLVEAFNRRGIKVQVLFLCKDILPTVPSVQNQVFEELEHIRFSIVPLRMKPKTRFARIRNEVYQFWIVWKYFCKCRYNLIYCDRIHIHFAAFFALLKQKVIVRLFGVASLPETLKKPGFDWFAWLHCLSFRAPFKYVICSKDGSPGNAFMVRHMRAGLSKECLFNGVDAVSQADGDMGDFDLRKKYRLKPDTPIILTTGNLKPDKSSEIFLEAVARFAQTDPDFLVINVGDGPLRDMLERKVDEYDLKDRIIYTGRVPHQAVYNFLLQANIYVSLNLYGNLSNAVLEAMKAGKCIVTLDKCAVSGRDEHLDDVELRDALVLIDRERIMMDLPNALMALIKCPEVVQEKERLMQLFANKHLKSWDERIAHEIELLIRQVKC